MSLEDEYDLGFVHPPNNGKAFKVTISNFKGQWYTHIREYIENPDDGVWFPTKKGIAIKAEYVDVLGQMFIDAGDLLRDIYLHDIETSILEAKQLNLFERE
jgi:hypothetical protein